MSMRDRPMIAQDNLAGRPAGEIMTVEDVIERFRDQWVLMRVTGHDEHQWPAKGYVLAHSFDRADITEAVKRQPPDSTLPPQMTSQPLYVFNAFPRARSGPEFETALKQLEGDFAAAKARHDARSRR